MGETIMCGMLTLNQQKAVRDRGEDKLSRQQIARVLKHHEIPNCWFESFYGLINDRRVPNRRVYLLTRRDPAFKAALNTMLDVMSEPYVRLFGDVPNKRAIAMAGKE